MDNLLLVIALLAIAITGFAGLNLLLQKKHKRDINNDWTFSHWIRRIFQPIIKPFIYLLIIYIVYFIGVLLITSSESAAQYSLFRSGADKIFSISVVLILFWSVIRLVEASTEQFYKWSIAKNNSIGIIIFPLIKRSLQVIATLALINLLLPYLSIPAVYLPVAKKSAGLLLIVAVTWIVLQIIHAGEYYFLQRYSAQIDENFQSRKIYTQITVFKKIAISIVIILALAFALMTFDRVRELGAALLASAGLITAIGAFAAQKTLASIFAGLQIAITQPLKINDAVIVENEFGTVEEINLSYVIVKLWDLRRLVVPINYFIERPFQNWTRHSSNLIGVVLLYVDYSLPVDKIREKFNEILAASPRWNKQISSVQVTDVKDETMELRFLVSADNAGETFNLRCEIREKMIAYIQEHYPHCLPKLRVLKLS